MSLTPCFGSLGDFAAAIQLLCQVRHALRSVGGSSTQCQELVVDIGKFEVLLREAGKLVLSDIPPDLGDHLKHCVLVATRAARDFHPRIEVYRIRLSKGSSKRGIQRVKDAFWKLKWSFVMASEAKEFRNQMRDQTIEIGSVLGLLNLKLTQVAASELNSRILDLHRGLFGDRMGFSEPLARNVKRFHVDEFPISLIDAMGIRHSLPFRMFTVYERLIEYIKDQFHDNPGRVLINRGRFAITNEKGNAISKYAYRNLIEPGSKLDMSVVVWRSIFDDEVRCPKCNSGIPPHSSSCASCDVSLLELDSKQWEAGPVMGGAVDKSNNVAPNQKTKRMDKVALFEMVKYFKRIMVFGETGQALAGCAVCRIRRKKCPGPSHNGDCDACLNLNIGCLRLYNQPVPVEYREQEVIAELTLWCHRLVNRTQPDPLSFMQFVQGHSAP